MDKDLISGNLGTVGSYDVAFKGGNLIVSLTAAIPPGESGSVTLSVDSNKVLDALAAAIPGKIDDAVIAIIKAALNG